MLYVDKLQELLRKHLLPQTVIFVLFLLLLLLVAAFGTLRYFLIEGVKKEMQVFTTRVEQGLKYKNGVWDTSQYTSDPHTPHPSGSSGFSTPLYIIASDGFVIERNSPINGLLDSADFAHLMAFQKPQTTKNITNEQWRILSQPIIEKNKIIGVIVASVYNPDSLILPDIDKKLSSNIQYIASRIKINKGTIDTSAVDIRDIGYDVSFEIVNNFNKVLLNNGRMPTYIDKSYVYHELQESRDVRFYTDSKNKETYLVFSRVLKDEFRNPVGVVIAGKSIHFVDQTLIHAAPICLIAIVLLTILAYYFFSYTQKNIVTKTVNQYDSLRTTRKLPKKISFEKRNGVLMIDEQTIEIPFASNQYYLCKAVFVDPKKRWEIDELLEAFGQEPLPEHWRKVYDSMILLNKKTEAYLPVKLIELRDKTYQLNPTLRPLLVRST